MTGPLLKSGSLTAFHPVGAVGNPVYLAASQLRAAIARRLGAEVADTFAVPQRNEDGDAVDWYAPQPGRVVPWSAATDSEREDAQQRLLTVRTQIQDLGRTMEAEASPERQVFGRLLAQVMQFPDEGDVHLVNGQPVLTFWGFVKDRAAVGSDPLRSLDLHRAAAGPSATGQSSERSRAWWLWPLIGLLLLLLLLLALLGLRGCEFPSTTTNSEQATTSDETRQLTGNEPPADPSAPPMTGDLNGDLTGDPREEPAAETANDSVPWIDPVTMARDRVLVRDSEGVQIDSDTLIGRRDTLLTDNDRIDAEGTDEALLDSIATDESTDTLVGDAVIDSAVDGVDAEGDPPLGSSGEDAVADDDIAEGIVGAEAAVAATGDEALTAEADIAGPPAPDAGSESSSEAGSEPAPDTAGAAAADQAPGEAPDQAPDQAAVDSEASSDAATTEPGAEGADEVDQSAGAAPSSPNPDESIDRAGAVDSTAAAAGSGPVPAVDAETGAGPKRTASAPPVRIPPERLLNSTWRTSTTLSDPKDGSPVQLDYQLKDGTGKIRLTRGDGSTCESGAGAQVRDGRLVVDSKSEIICADGTNFGRPQIDCTPSAGGKARCVGRYADGSTFPIYMEQRAD